MIGHASIKTTDRYLHRLEAAALEAGSAPTRYAAKQLDSAASEDELAEVSRSELIRKERRDLLPRLRDSRRHCEGHCC